MTQTFFCPQCRLHKPISARIVRPGRKDSCNSCNEKAKAKVEGKK